MRISLFSIEAKSISQFDLNQEEKNRWLELVYFELACARTKTALVPYRQTTFVYTHTLFWFNGDLFSMITQNADELGKKAPNSIGEDNFFPSESKTNWYTHTHDLDYVLTDRWYSTL